MGNIFILHRILFKDANVLIQLRDWFFSPSRQYLLALIIFWVGRYAIKWVKTLLSAL